MRPSIRRRSLYPQHVAVGIPRRPSPVTVRQGTLLSSPVPPLTDTDLARERPTGAADRAWDRATATLSFCAKMTAVTAVSKPTCLALGSSATGALAAGDAMIVLDTIIYQRGLGMGMEIGQSSFRATRLEPQRIRKSVSTTSRQKDDRHPLDV